jgi:hypothetical protein
MLLDVTLAFIHSAGNEDASNLSIVKHGCRVFFVLFLVGDVLLLFKEVENCSLCGGPFFGFQAEGSALLDMNVR